MTAPLTSLFALTGTMQGFVLWWLWHADKFHQWPASQPMAFAAMLYAAIAVPLAVYWTQGVEGFSRRLRVAAVAMYGAGYAALGAYSTWVVDPAPAEVGFHPANVLAAIVLGFVSLSLLCGFDVAARRWRYARLFQYTWRNGILSATAAAMTGAVWTVLYAGAALMGLIQVKWVLELIKEPVFAFPVTGLVVAGAFALGLARAAMTEAIRRFWLSMSSWLLLLILFFGVMWVLWVPFTGLDALFSTKHAALLMLWFSALAVKFANCAYQDGELVWPYPRWLSYATQAAWLSLLPVVAIAWWALGLRVAQHGWSEDRLWATLVAAVALIYAVGYALSWLERGRWMAAMARTNIVAALALCLGLLAFLSPVANIQRLAVSAHVNRVIAAGGGVEPDWNYLRWQSGRFGRQALRDLATGAGVPAGKTWAKQATETLAKTGRYTDESQQTVTAALMVDKLALYPAGKTLPATFVQYARSENKDWRLKNCLNGEGKCSLWLGDLNGDGQDELVLFSGPQSNSLQSGTLFSFKANAWSAPGTLSPSNGPALDLAQLQNAQPAPAEWRDLLIGGKRFYTSIYR
jgi:hypothetical protein